MTQLTSGSFAASQCPGNGWCLLWSGQTFITRCYPASTLAVLGPALYWKPALGQGPAEAAE